MSSSVLPENIDPQMTSIEPAFFAFSKNISRLSLKNPKFVIGVCKYSQIYLMESRQEQILAEIRAALRNAREQLDLLESKFAEFTDSQDILPEDLPVMSIEMDDLTSFEPEDEVSPDGEAEGGDVPSVDAEDNGPVRPAEAEGGDVPSVDAEDNESVRPVEGEDGDVPSVVLDDDGDLPPDYAVEVDGDLPFGEEDSPTVRDAAAEPFLTEALTVTAEASTDSGNIISNVVFEDVAAVKRDVPATTAEAAAGSVAADVSEAVVAVPAAGSVAADVSEAVVAVPAAGDAVATENDAAADAEYERVRTKYWLTDIAGIPVRDVRSAISMNDKILFINTLFGEDPLVYQEVIQKINASPDLKQAIVYLLRRFPAWNLDSDVVYRFMMAVRRRLM